MVEIKQNGVLYGVGEYGEATQKDGEKVLTIKVYGCEPVKKDLLNPLVESNTREFEIHGATHDKIYEHSAARSLHKGRIKSIETDPKTGKQTIEFVL